MKERYAQRLPALRETARSRGYALAVHGNGERDLDLIAVPWTEDAVSDEVLIEALRVAADGVVEQYDDHGLPTHLRRNPTHKPHRRRAWTIQIGGGLYLDVSVMPRVSESEGETMSEQIPSIGRVVHFVHGDRHIPALITDPAFIVNDVETGAETPMVALVVFPPLESHFSTVANYDASGKPATWHWPEHVPAQP